jgi:uncharacterized membrane protein YhhN
MRSLWHILFSLDVLVNLAGIISNQPTLVFLSKPLLMPLLAAWLWTETKSSSGMFRSFIALALAFSTLGDVLLIFEGGIYFLAGLGAFLIAHLCYIRAFFKVGGVNNGYIIKRPIVLAPFLAYPVLLLLFLWEGIPSGMKVPVCAYAGVITVMALSTMNLKGRIPSGVFVSLLSGAILFVLSDSLIAVARFGEPFEGSRLAVMLTYITGQYLLVLSAIRWLNNPANVTDT